jgi:hypothetical protein
MGPLATDIHHVTTAAMRMIISLVSAMQGANVSIASFSVEALKKQLHMSVHAMEHDYWFFPTHFREITGQFAFQSVWVTGTSESDCPVCGTMHEREDPFSRSMRDVDISAFRTS